MPLGVLLVAIILPTSHIFLDFSSAGQYATKKAGSQGCVGKRYNFFTNFWSGTPARRQVTLENCVYSGQGGGMIYMETGLKASITTTNKRTKGGGEFNMRNNMR